jgi:Flp pilus assembly protein TadG
VYRTRKLVSLARDARGQSVIEFAIVLPLLLALVFGITEFGRALWTVNVMTSAAREGVRVAVVTGPDWTRVDNRVREVCNAAGIRASNGPRQVQLTAITHAYSPTDVEKRVTVTVTANFNVLTGRVLGRFSGTIPLSASASMRHES